MYSCINFSALGHHWQLDRTLSLLWLMISAGRVLWYTRFKSFRRCMAAKSNIWQKLIWQSQFQPIRSRLNWKTFDHRQPGVGLKSKRTCQLLSWHPIWKSCLKCTRSISMTLLTNLMTVSWWWWTILKNTAWYQVFQVDLKPNTLA